MTPAAGSQIGAVWHTVKQPISDGFLVSFSFQITSPGADGFAFVIQNESENAIGQDGCQMGFGGIKNR